MHVRQGWSGEVKPNQWAKFDVELDEGDLQRLLLMAGIDTLSPAALPVSLAFQLLEVEAEFLVIAKLVARYEYPAEQAGPQFKALDKQKGALLDRIRALVPANV